MKSLKCTIFLQACKG